MQYQINLFLERYSLIIDWQKPNIITNSVGYFVLLTGSPGHFIINLLCGRARHEQSGDLGDPGSRKILQIAENSADCGKILQNIKYSM